ncbi:MAG: RNA degradosome polyphosphate kinase [Lachnospiraceae bacterium]|nr:RNA degradosome polyphosphate kinase [Lachnospiraceae bacterium]
MHFSNSVNLDDPKLYENRELSWIKFNRRVLNETRDDGNPLMEKVGFLSITASNLDEFYMVRVASLKDMVHAGYRKKDIAGLTASEQLTLINKETKKFSSDQYQIYNDELLPLLEKEGIKILSSYEELNEEQNAFVDKYFEAQVYPVLTPMAVDASRPFPLVRNKTLNIAAMIQSNPDRVGLVRHEKKKKVIEFATVQVPSVLPRLVPIPSVDGEGETFILLEQIIEKNLDKLYLNYDVVSAFPYRIMRNADFDIEEDEAEDLLKEIERQLRKRDWGEVIRLEVESGIDKKLLNVLKTNLGIKEQDVFKINGPIDLTFLSKIPKKEDRCDLYFKPYVPVNNPRLLPGCDIFSEIRKGDIFLQHPYESFDPVVDFIKTAADDPKVLAIKQTLYRVSGNSPIIEALSRAALNGKQVSVLVELKARFDEQHNIVWAKKLEHAGCHVIYGVVGLKTHCKIALIVRREEDGIRRYVHLGTGNYNDSTAKHYTDCGMFTCSESYGEDATAVFNMLSGYSEPAVWNRLVVAPIWMRERFNNMIDREIAHAKAGRKGLIIAKLNSLCDEKLIKKLYEASQAGVEIKLIIRGICSLKVGVPGVSENISVISIVGEFLEHARIFYFYNDGQEDMYLGSADWMPRNLDRRVEIVYPVEDSKIKEEVFHYLEVELNDTRKAYILNKNGAYSRSKTIDENSGSQEIFKREAEERLKRSKGYGAKKKI